MGDATTREAATGKAKTIHDLLDSADEIKQAVRDDLTKLIKRLPIESVLSDDGQLEEFLSDCVRAVMRRHVVAPSGVSPELQRAITAYVRGMLA